MRRYSESVKADVRRRMGPPHRRKVVVWDVAEREDRAIAADLASRARLRERISNGRRQALRPHADNGNAMRVSTLESRLDELGVFRAFSRPRVSNDNQYSESLFRTARPA